MNGLTVSISRFVLVFVIGSTLPERHSLGQLPKLLHVSTPIYFTVFHKQVTFS